MVWDGWSVGAQESDFCCGRGRGGGHPARKIYFYPTIVSDDLRSTPLLVE